MASPLQTRRGLVISEGSEGRRAACAQNCCVPPLPPLATQVKSCPSAAISRHCFRARAGAKTHEAGPGGEDPQGQWRKRMCELVTATREASSTLTGWAANACGHRGNSKSSACSGGALSRPSEDCPVCGREHGAHACATPVQLVQRPWSLEHGSSGRRGGCRHHEVASKAGRHYQADLGSQQSQNTAYPPGPT